MNRTRTSIDSTAPANNNAATIGAIRAIVDRQVSELIALTASPGERAWLAQIATQAIERGLGGVQS